MGKFFSFKKKNESMIYKDNVGPKAYIHVNRLKNNLSLIKDEIGDKSLMIVVKANGYGHGVLNITNSLKEDKSIIFCVFTIEEAMELRKNNIKNNILIFSKIQPSWLKTAHENNFWINLTCFEDLDNIIEYHKRFNGAPKIHLKFDTGMTRLGFDLNDAEALFITLNKNKILPIEGIYSHFSTADEGDLTFALKQLSKFNKIVELGVKSGLRFKHIHCSNSGAILNLPDSYFNTVRVGMLLYGVAPSNEVEMSKNYLPVMSFCGSIIHVRRVPSNTPVSYGGKYITSEETYIGVIQTGFADGFPRPWYEDGFVSYKGNNYKIAGRVCMDQLMVDFGDIKPKIGEEVLFFGEKGKDKIPIEDIAEKILTTTYVLLTGIHGRTKRINI